MRKFFVLLTLIIILSSMALFCWFYLKSTSPNQTNSHIETIKIKYEPSYHFSGIQSPTQITKILLETDKGYIHNWFIKNNDIVKKHQPLFEYYNPTTEHLIAKKQKYLSHLKQKKHDYSQLLVMKSAELNQKLNHYNQHYVPSYMLLLKVTSI